MPNLTKAQRFLLAGFGLLIFLIQLIFLFYSSSLDGISWIISFVVACFLLLLSFSPASHN